MLISKNRLSRFLIILKFKPHHRLIKFLAQSLLFCCIIFSLQPLKAQSPTADPHEKDFFDKVHLIASEQSDGTTKKLEILIKQLDSLSVSKETGDKILQRLLLEADRTAASDLAKAKVYWQAAELIASQLNDRSILATAIYYRANSLAAIDKYQPALLEYRRAVNVLQDKSIISDKEKSLLCEIYTAAGETASSIDEYETSKEFFSRGWQTLQTIKDWQKSNILVRIARAILLGQGDNARQSGDYALAADKLSAIFTLLGKDDFGRAELLWELGKLKRDAGDFAAGAANFSEAVKLLDKLPVSVIDKESRVNLLANLYNSLGLLMLEQRFSKGAERNLEQALALARELKDLRLEGTIIKNLSIAARQQEDYQTARLRASAALEIAATADFTDLYTSANSILASLAQNAGNHQEAVERLQKSLFLAEEKGNILRRVESQWRLGESFFALGKYDAAKKLAADALSAAQGKQWSNLSYLSATLLGRILVKEGNTGAAIDAFELAIREIEQKRHLVAGADIEKISFMRDKTSAYHELLKMRLKIGDIERAFAVSEKLKSRILEDRLGGQKKNDSGLNTLSPNLPNDTVVISYTVTDENCLAFVFHPREAQPKVFAISESNKNLTDKIKSLRAGMFNFDPSFKMRARELYALLLKNLGRERSALLKKSLSSLTAYCGNFPSRL